MVDPGGVRPGLMLLSAACSPNDFTRPDRVCYLVTSMRASARGRTQGQSPRTIFVGPNEKKSRGRKKKRGDAERRIKRRLWGLRDKISQITLFSRMSRGRRLQGKLSRADHTWETLFTCKTHTDTDIYSYRSTACIWLWNLCSWEPWFLIPLKKKRINTYFISILNEQSRLLYEFSKSLRPQMKVFIYFSCKCLFYWVFFKQKLVFHCNFAHFLQSIFDVFGILNITLLMQRVMHWKWHHKSFNYFFLGKK